MKFRYISYLYTLDKVYNFITFLYDFVFHRNHGFVRNPHDMSLLVIGNVIGGGVYVTKLPLHIWASGITWIDNEPTIRYIDIQTKSRLSVDNQFSFL